MERVLHVDVAKGVGEPSIDGRPVPFLLIRLRVLPRLAPVPLFGDPTRRQGAEVALPVFHGLQSAHGKIRRIMIPARAQRSESVRIPRQARFGLRCGTETRITEDDNEEYDAPTFLGLPDEGAGLQTTETRTFTDTYDNDSAGPTMGVPMTVLDQTSFTKVEGETFDDNDLEGMSIPDS